MRRVVTGRVCPVFVRNAGRLALQLISKGITTMDLESENIDLAESASQTCMEHFVIDERGFYGNPMAMRVREGKTQFSPRSALRLHSSQRAYESAAIHKSWEKKKKNQGIEQITASRRWARPYYLVINLCRSLYGQRMDEIICEKQLIIFMQRLAKKIDRYGKKVGDGSFYMLGAFEPNEQGQHWHWNLLVDFPPNLSMDEYREIVHRCLDGMPWVLPRKSVCGEANRYMKEAEDAERVAKYMQKFNRSPFFYGMAGRKVSLVTQ